MGYIVRLHRAYRKLLLLYGRLKSLKLVKADFVFVCCHVAELRVVFSTPRRPHNNRLRAVIIRVWTPLRLVTTMRSLTVARYAIANEIMRRRNQIECNHTLHLRSNCTHAAFIILLFEEAPNAQTPIEQQSGQGKMLKGLADSLQADWQVTETADSSTTGLERNDASLARHQISGMWNPRIACQQNNAHFATLRQKMKRSAQDSSRAQTASSPSINLEQSEFGSNKDGDLPTPQNIATQLDSDTAYTVFRFPVLKMSFDMHDFYKDSSRSNPPSPLIDDPNDSASPTSDTTLMEEPIIQSLHELKRDDSLQDHISYDRMEEHVRPYEESIMAPIGRRVHHYRNFSTDSAWSTSRTSTIPLRARAKTNDGMLQFKASPSKTSRPPIAPNTHRRKISLNLPIKPIEAQPEVAQQTTIDSSDTDSIYHTPYSHVISSSDLTQEERELEYKHRHTFIGTASLDDFLELLELAAEHTTTKEAVAKAFIHLSSTEQLHARQCSTKAYGWELVSRITPDVSSIDYVAQWQVKLGSITLRHFLDLIPFDGNEECSALRVVEAFSAASHIDGKVGVGTGSKARAFRSWMLQQESH